MKTGDITRNNTLYFLDFYGKKLIKRIGTFWGKRSVFRWYTKVFHTFHRVFHRVRFLSKYWEIIIAVYINYFHTSEKPPIFYPVIILTRGFFRLQKNFLTALKREHFAKKTHLQEVTGTFLKKGIDFMKNLRYNG